MASGRLEECAPARPDAGLNDFGGTSLNTCSMEEVIIIGLLRCPVILVLQIGLAAWQLGETQLSGERRAAAAE